MTRFWIRVRENGVDRDVEIGTGKIGGINPWPLAIVLSLWLWVAIELVVRAAGVRA